MADSTAPGIESQVRDANLFEWDFAPMPKHPQTGKSTVQLGSNTWSILANTRNREEAWKFVEFMMGVDGQTWMMKYGIPGITQRGREPGTTRTCTRRRTSRSCR